MEYALQIGPVLQRVIEFAGGGLNCACVCRRWRRHCPEAIETGFRDISTRSYLRWLVDNGLDADADICHDIAVRGDVPLLRFARKLGFSWDTVCDAAAGAGRIDVLRTARAEGARWDSFTMCCAARGDHPKVLRWLMQTELPCFGRNEACRALSAARRAGAAGSVAFLERFVD